MQWMINAEYKKKTDSKYIKYQIDEKSTIKCSIFEHNL